MNTILDTCKETIANGYVDVMYYQLVVNEKGNYSIKSASNPNGKWSTLEMFRTNKEKAYKAWSSYLRDADKE